MEALIAILVLAGAGAAAVWWPRWRLRRALARPWTEAQLHVLRASIPFYAALSAPQQQQLLSLVRQFLHQKTFVGCAGLEVTEEMRITVAAQACLLLLERPSRVYPRLHAILMYPTEFLVPRKEVDGAGVVTETRRGLLGESWGDGRVILSWDHVQQACADWEGATNVVLHEFAHQLDSESGATNGAPYLGDPSRYASWADVFSREFRRLRREAAYGASPVLDPYGASDPAEFFAVAAETYFTRPHALAAWHPELYAQLLAYFRADPRAWIAEPPPEPVASYAASYGQWH